MSKRTIREQNKRLLAISRRQLRCGVIKASMIAAEIRRRFPDCPQDIIGKYAIMGWFVEQKVGPSPAVSRPKYHYQDSSDSFLKSYEWRKLRMEVIKARGARCECCGAHPSDGVTVINVDHIQPRKTHPQLSLEIKNLQVLCSACNHGKGNRDSTDWRTKEEVKPRLVKSSVCDEEMFRPMWSKKV
jgi:5-methylcytosine-specific restriction endonuclease McrA